MPQDRRPPDPDRRLVYSTDGSLPLPRFDLPRKLEQPRPGAKPGVPDDGVVRVGCERRRGGSMTLIYNLRASDLGTLDKELKRRCGAGGTTKNGVVELQGDHRDTAIAFLAERGVRAKKMGG